jgi:CRP-like cAMP-binding protein
MAAARRRKNPIHIETTEIHMCSLDLRLKILREVPFFRSLDDTAVESVNRNFREKGFSPGEVIYNTGDRGTHLYVVAEGRVSLRRLTPSGKQVMLDLLVPGEFFGSLGQDPQPYSDTAQAQTAVCVLVITVDDFRAVLRAHPSAALDVLDTVSARLHEARDAIHLLSAETAEKRIAHTLLKLSRKLGKTESFGLLIQTPLSREVLAEMTGVTTETASRVVSQFQKEGWIDTGREWMALKDSTALEAVLEAEN